MAITYNGGEESKGVGLVIFGVCFLIAGIVAMWAQCKKHRFIEIVFLIGLVVAGLAFFGYGGWLISTLESAKESAQDAYHDIKSGDFADKVKEGYNDAKDKLNDLLNDDDSQINSTNSTDTFDNFKKLVDGASDATGVDIVDVAGKLTGLIQEQYENIPASFYDISAYDIDGNLVSMSDYEGQLLLIVNVASC